MHSKSDNIEIMINDEADKVIELFNSLGNRYQNNLESYIDSLYWIKNKKARINPVNKKR